MEERITITLKIECPICGAEHEVTMEIADYYAWEHGARIQDVAPYLSATQREQLISGMCPDCQVKVFGGDDEDEDDDYEDEDYEEEDDEDYEDEDEEEEDDEEEYSIDPFFQELLYLASLIGR